MSDYQYGQFQNQSAPAGEVNPDLVQGSIRQNVLKAYMWMFIGLLISGGVSLVCTLSGLGRLIYSSPMLPMMLCLVQIGLTMAFTYSMQKASVGTLRMMFIAFCVTMGLTLTSLGMVYDMPTIFLALLITAVYFGCLVIVGWTTNKDLTSLGTICLVGLIAMLIGSVIAMFFGGPSALLMTIVGMLLFTGITAWDVQRLNQTMVLADGQPVAQEKWAIYFALELYLDFINIFLYVLRFLGRNSRN